MTRFDIALDRTLKHEGGFVNDPKDPGGMTYCGISRKAWPNWAGWDKIDEELADGVTPRPLTHAHLLGGLVSDFYRVNFWTPLHGDEIASQEIAEYLFDFSVNSGISDAVKALQLSIPMCSPYHTAPDGIMGKNTLKLLDDLCNAKWELELLLAMRTCRLAHYLETIADNPKLARFARGWARRALA